VVTVFSIYFKWFLGIVLILDLDDHVVELFHGYQEFLRKNKCWINFVPTGKDLKEL